MHRKESWRRENPKERERVCRIQRVHARVSAAIRPKSPEDHFPCSVFISNRVVTRLLVAQASACVLFLRSAEIKEKTKTKTKTKIKIKIKIKTRQAEACPTRDPR